MAQCWSGHCEVLGQVVRKPVSINPGLKVNRSTNFSSIKMLFAACVLCGLSLVKLKAEGQIVVIICAYIYISLYIVISSCCNLGEGHRFLSLGL